MKQFTCPECGSHYFGTSNCTGPQDTWIRHCHGYYDDARRCDFSFVIADDDKYFADEQNGSKEIDMELRKEYADIVERERAAMGAPIGGNTYNAFINLAAACQELADRPPRELTASEKYHLWLSVYDGVFGSTRCTNGSEVIDKIIAAFLEKQREPQVVKFRAARNTSTEVVHMFPADDAPNGCWEWLEPAQEFEVKLP